MSQLPCHSTLTLDKQCSIDNLPAVCRMPVPDPEPVHHVEDRTIPGPASQLPVRIYKPQAPAGQQLSALVYYHGGGFIFGGLQSHDPMCRAVANKVPCIVVSVDYRYALSRQRALPYLGGHFSPHKKRTAPNTDGSVTDLAMCMVKTAFSYSCCTQTGNV